MLSGKADHVPALFPKDCLQYAAVHFGVSACFRYNVIRVLFRVNCLKVFMLHDNVFLHTLARILAQIHGYFHIFVQILVYRKDNQLLLPGILDNYTVEIGGLAVLLRFIDRGFHDGV